MLIKEHGSTSPLNKKKLNYFKTIRNKKDKRSIFILPTELTIKVFSDYVDKRAWLYKAIK